MNHSVHVQEGAYIVRIDLPPSKPDSDVTVVAVKTRGEITADKRPHQYESGKVLIPAWSLEVKGTKAKMLFDGYEKIAHVSNWSDPAETLSCDFVANKPGRYQVNVTYCSDAAAAGSTVALSFNGERLGFTSEDTGGWTGGNYRVKNCGTVLLSKAGEQHLSLVPVQNGWKNLAIKEVVLAPEK